MRYPDIWKSYIVSLDEKGRDAVLDVLETAMKASVDAVPGMPYGVPGLTLNKRPLIAVAAHKAHFGIYPFSPAVIEMVRHLLHDVETAKGTIRFPYGTKPSRSLIRTLVKLRAKELG